MSLTKPVIIVSGLPRSGTSMMMQMLQAGGIPAAYDDRRPADEFNPYGYFELEEVKKLEQDNSWLKNYKGNVVKILFHLLKFLPEDIIYNIIFMQRNLTDIINSQNKMLKGYGKSSDKDDRIFSILNNELVETTTWLKNQKNMNVLFLNYTNVLSNPQDSIRKIEEFLAVKMNTAKMEAVIKTS